MMDLNSFLLEDSPRKQLWCWNT